MHEFHYTEKYARNALRLVWHFLAVMTVVSSIIKVGSPLNCYNKLVTLFEIYESEVFDQYYFNTL